MADNVQLAELQMVVVSVAVDMLGHIITTMVDRLTKDQALHHYHQ